MSLLLETRRVEEVNALHLAKFLTLVQAELEPHICFFPRPQSSLMRAFGSDVDELGKIVVGQILDLLLAQQQATVIASQTLLHVIGQVATWRVGRNDPRPESSQGIDQ